MKKLSGFILLALSLAGYSQINQPWQGKKCAVVLTYDDAIDQHLDNALPVLDSLGLKATFYVTGFSKSMQTRLDDWRRLASHQHELGNHTLFHPCIGNLPGREWVSVENDMSRYTVERMNNEVRMTNLFLQALDGKTKRTFAFTCGDMKINGVEFIKDLKKDFIAARAVRNEMHKIRDVDLYNVDCYMVNGHSGTEMISWVKKAMESNSLLVILFHGVGGGNALDVSIPAHREVLQFIKQNEKDIWVAPMVEIAEHIDHWQTRNKVSKIQQHAIRADDKNMLTQLKIESTRSGPSGNPSAMVLGAMHAGPGYRLSEKDPGSIEFPRIETELTDSGTTFRQHGVRHSTGPDWPCIY